VHLVANYLGIYELWNEVTPCLADDFVDETPNHNAPNDLIGTIAGGHHLNASRNTHEFYGQY
jgi:hypothetical protein